MFGKVQEIEDRYAHLESELARPEIIKDQKIYQKYLKEHSQAVLNFDAHQKPDQRTHL